MRARSLRRQREMREYVKAAEQFLEEHHFCQFPRGCCAPATMIHHARGRSGQRLLDQEWWRAACWFHNDYAESHTGAALDCGWLVRIEGAA